MGDEEWDQLGDDEFDAMVEMSYVPPGPRVRPPPPESSFRWAPPARTYDRQLAVLTPGSAGEFLRACRASAGLSQRQVAEAAGIAHRTLARIEAGHTEDVRLSTIVRLAEECDVILVGTTTGSYAPLLETDLAQRHRDRADRFLPAHLVNSPRPPIEHQFMPRRDRHPTSRRYEMTRIRDVPDD